jgi:ankyrin repeat protein
MNYVRILKNSLMLTLCSAMLSAMLTEDSKDEIKHSETINVLSALFKEEQEMIAIINATHNPAKLGAYLHRAAERGFLAAINILLIEKKVAVDYPDAHGSTPLNLTAKNGYSACMLALLEAGADINSKPTKIEHCSSLHEVVRNGHNDCVRILISKKKTFNLTIDIVDH